jgi:hypothetical protein
MSETLVNPESYFLDWDDEMIPAHEDGVDFVNKYRKNTTTRQ